MFIGIFLLDMQACSPVFKGNFHEFQLKQIFQKAQKKKKSNSLRQTKADPNIIWCVLSSYDGKAKIETASLISWTT